MVARYEDVEVDNDNIGNLANRGDTYDAEKWLIGLNWYVNNNVRFMLNYIDAEVDEALAQAKVMVMMTMVTPFHSGLSTFGK